jgi:hypothetical protein
VHHRWILTALALLPLAGRAFAAEPAPAWLVAPHDPSLVPPAPPSYFELHAARVERNIHIFQQGYTLEQNRQRDQLRLYGSTPGTPTSTMAGIGVFSMAVFSVAHTPKALGFAFDRGMHLGPAIFDGGGMGAGFGGHL